MSYDLTALDDERASTVAMRGPSDPSWLSYAASTWDEAQSLGSAVYFHHEIAPTDAHAEAIDFQMDVLAFPGVTLALKLARDVVEDELSLLLGRRLPEPLQFDSEFSLGTPETMRWFGGLRMLGDALTEPRMLASQWLVAAELRNLIVLGMLMGQRHNYTDALAGTAAPASASVARHAVELLEADPARAWTIGMLAAECSCSVRALQAGFQRVFGVSPSAYLQNLRLECARRDLQLADAAESSVSRIAHAWGFGHLGRFSVNFRARFGESPSETLRR